MRILVVGASGTLGSAICRELGSRHEIVTAGRNSGDERVDVEDFASIQAMYQRVGTVDAVVSALGKVHFGALSDMTPDLMAIGLRNKLMGQVNLVLAGTPHVADGGSFTLISGILAHDPIKLGTSASLVNGAIESFVEAAAIELPRGIRINAVSPASSLSPWRAMARSSAATSRCRWRTPRWPFRRASKACARPDLQRVLSRGGEMLRMADMRDFLPTFCHRMRDIGCVNRGNPAVAKAVCRSCPPQKATVSAFSA